MSERVVTHIPCRHQPHFHQYIDDLLQQVATELVHIEEKSRPVSHLSL